MQAPFDGVPACVIYGEETESLPPKKKSYLGYCDIALFFINCKWNYFPFL
jgi:hypothetical protein